MRKALIVLVCFAVAMTCGAQSKAKRGLEVGSSDNVLTIDSIVLVNGMAKFYSSGAAVGVYNDSIILLLAAINDTISLDSVARTKDDIVTQIPVSIGGGLSGDSSLFEGGRRLFTTWWEGPDALGLDTVRSAVDQGSFNLQIYWGASRATATDSAFSSAQTINSTTTGTLDYTFTSDTIPARRWIWPVISSVSAPRPTEGSVNIIGWLINGE